MNKDNERSLPFKPSILSFPGTKTYIEVAMVLTAGADIVLALSSFRVANLLAVNLAAEARGNRRQAAADAPLVKVFASLLSSRLFKDTFDESVQRNAL